MKLRIKIIECIQAVSILSIIVSATLVLGGAEYASTKDNFMWQFRTGIGYILISTIVIGCMELLRRFERYRLQKKYDQEWINVFEDIEKAQQRSGNSKLGN